MFFYVVMSRPSQVPVNLNVAGLRLRMSTLLNSKVPVKPLTRRTCFSV